MNTQKLSIGVAALVGVVGVASSALGERVMKAPRIESPELVAMRTRSNAEALGARQVAIYKRKPGPGSRVLASRILGNLSSLGLSQAEIAEAVVKEDAGTQLVAGKSWFVHVAGEGRFGRMWRTPVTSVDVESRMSYDEVVELGRSAFAHQLADLVGIRASEPLPVLMVSYRGRTGGSTDGTDVESRVLASYVTFGRVFDGLPVIGNGAFIKIGFDVEGRLLGFDFTWSEYEATGAVQTTALKEELLSRIPMASGGQATSGPSQVECGYFDSGVQGSGVLTLLQPACAYKLTGERGDRHTVVVPAGEEFTAEDGWAESLALSMSAK